MRTGQTVGLPFLFDHANIPVSKELLLAFFSLYINAHFCLLKSKNKVICLLSFVWQGFVWVLEPEKVPKISTDGLPVGVSKEPKKKNIVEVCPVKKYAKIKDHSLILIDTDGSTTIDLLDCTVVAVSSSNLSSRKW